MFSRPFPDSATASLPENVHTYQWRSILPLLAQMEASLKASQQALMSRDLTAIEQGIREQTDLQKAFARLLATEGHPREVPGEITRELRTAAARILELGRVQVLLLRRGQRSLKMMASLLAGPASNYGPIISPAPKSTIHPAGLERSTTACPA
jgi:hypothetical protein